MVLGASDGVLLVAGHDKAVRIEFSQPFQGGPLVKRLVEGIPELELQECVGPTAIAALADLLDRAGDRQNASRTDPGIMSLLDLDAASDPRGRALVAGDEVLLLPTAVDASTAQAALRRWVSTFSPDGRLRIYAASLSSRPATYGCTPPPPRMLAALKRRNESALPAETCEALTWNGDDLAVVGHFSDGLETGRFRFPQVLSRNKWHVGEARLHQAVGLAPCSNLRAVGFEDTQPARDTCSGVDWSPAGAHRRFLGEAVERFALGDPAREQLVRCPEPALAGEVLSPSEIVRYDEQQLHRLGVDSYQLEDETWWASGTRADGTPVWVPAPLIWAPFPRPGWLGSGVQTTNGAAAGASPDDAAQRAWLELVERDALLRCWWGRRPPAQITARGTSVALLEFLRKRADEVHLLLLPAAFGICVIAAIALSPVGLRIGCSAGVPALAAERACVELAMLQTDQSGRSIEATDVRLPADHARYWSGTSARQRASWLLEGPLLDLDHLSFPSPPTDRSSCPDEAAAWVTLRSSVRNQSVVRCVSPALLPLTFGYDTELRGHPRALDLPSTPGPWEPHPFA